jgi:hypothetical protein
MNWDSRYKKEASVADFINRQRTKGISKEFQSLADLDTRNTLSHAMGYHLKQCEHHEDLANFHANAGDGDTANTHVFAHDLHARAHDANRLALMLHAPDSPEVARLDAVEHAKNITDAANLYSQKLSNDWNLGDE